MDLRSPWKKEFCTVRGLGITSLSVKCTDGEPQFRSPYKHFSLATSFLEVLASKFPGHVRKNAIWDFGTCSLYATPIEVCYELFRPTCKPLAYVFKGFEGRFAGG